MKSNKPLAVLSAVFVAGIGLLYFMLRGGPQQVSVPARNVMSVDAVVAVPLWLLVVLWMMVLTAIGAALLMVIHRRRSIVPETPGVTKAEIFGMRWRWTYDGGVMSGLKAHCPKCDQPVSARVENRHGFLHLISYQCVCRKWHSKSFQCSEAQMLDRVSEAIAKQAAAANVSVRAPAAA
jgi:hypothetical protein